jgi:GNAT superfamily N-acetyltransferase|tara:strand:- start:108 stop:920 length:813 start_codon:yes stop_codon:yes gene_type:complete
MNVVDIEQASRTAWPALQEKEFPFGVLRLSKGLTPRSNSLTLSMGAPFNFINMLSVTEGIFRKCRLPTILRVIDPGYATVGQFKELDCYLADSGYALEATTEVMLVNLEAQSNVHLRKSRCTKENKLKNLFCIHSCGIEDWLVAWAELTLSSEEKSRIFHGMLSTRSKTSHFLVAREYTGKTVSCGMAVQAEKTIGVFGVATHKYSRRKGLASSVINQLLQWGSENEATHGYLQVERTNYSAKRVYEKLGFRKLYSYWYRVKPLAINPWC